MKKTTTYQLIVYVIFSILIACSKSEANDITPPTTPDKEEEGSEK